jgi:phosphatidylglycerophosphate synthase
VSVVSPGLRDRVRGIATPVALAMGRVGLTPNALTLIGFAGTCVAAGFVEGAVLAAAAMASAFMVSYARAKSEGLGFTEGSGMAAVGLAPREIRLVILTIGLIWTGIAGGLAQPWTAGTLPLAASLGLITVLATITVIQRILHVVNQNRKQENQ